MNTEKDAMAQDMAELRLCDEPNVLHSLCTRYEAGLIYTYCSSMLIAINPWAEKPGLYSLQQCALYRRAALKDLPPHCFGIADQAYSSMSSGDGNQSILVSGESGAGKTETARFLLQHLTFCSRADRSHSLQPAVKQECDQADGATLCALEQRILATNPILEVRERKGERRRGGGWRQGDGGWGDGEAGRHRYMQRCRGVRPRRWERRWTGLAY